MSRLAGGIVAAIAVVWLLVALGLVAVIGLEAVTRSDVNCPVPGLEGVYGDSSWQWLPPGEVCSVRGATFEEPPTSRTWLIVAEVVVGLGLLVAWRRLRDAPDPDWTA